MIRTFFLLFLLAFSAIHTATAQQPTFTIAFGSCNRQDEPQPMWKAIAADDPTLWVWLGDNIYGDSDDMAVLKQKYDEQKAIPDYKSFTAKVPVIGTWDDHDYGRNDAGKNYPHKEEAQQLALDFLGVPKKSAQREQEGIYSAHEYKAGSKTIKVILLDARYHRDTILKDTAKQYIANTSGDMLGETQWKWLEKELRSDADAYVIGSGVQVVAEQHPYEKWANFPAARKRLFQLLATTKAKGVLMLSGDRHIGEISKISVPGVNYPVYDVTSSGLTHSSTNNTSEKNSYRVGPLVNQKNYGLLRFTTNGGKLQAQIDLKGEGGKTFYTEKVAIK